MNEYEATIEDNRKEMRALQAEVGAVTVYEKCLGNACWRYFMQTQKETKRREEADKMLVSHQHVNCEVLIKKLIMVLFSD